MEVYRLTRQIYGKTLSGKGAAIMGSRWSSPGKEVIFAASNRSLAMAEVVVHFSLGMAPTKYYMLTIYIPDDIRYERKTVSDLPRGWNLYPYLKNTRIIGDEFIAKGESCLLFVPSAVTKGDFNVLINPAHTDYNRISIIEADDFPFDRRLFK